MDILLGFIVIAAALFAAMFFMERRFGLLGLALAAGSLLSSMWSYDGGLVAGLFNFPNTPWTEAAVSVIILLLPAIVLLFHKDKYKTIVGRTIGAALFALLALAFLVEPISHVAALQGVAAEVFGWFDDNKDIIIGGGLVLAVVDLLLIRPVHLPGKQHKH